MNEPPSIERELHYRDAMGALLEDILAKIKKKEAIVAVLEERLAVRNGELADLCDMRDGIEASLAIEPSDFSGE